MMIKVESKIDHVPVIGDLSVVSLNTSQALSVIAVGQVSQLSLVESISSVSNGENLVLFGLDDKDIGGQV